ncbi:unnamed protein product [Brassica oleracea]
MAIAIFFIVMLLSISVTYFAPVFKLLLRDGGTLGLPHRRLKRRFLTSLSGALSLWLMVSGPEVPSLPLSPTAATTSLPNLLPTAPEKTYASLVCGLETIRVISETSACRRAHPDTSTPTINRLTRLSPLAGRFDNSMSQIWYDGAPTPKRNMEPTHHLCSVASPVTGHRSSPSAVTTLTSSHQQLAFLPPQLPQSPQRDLITDLNARPHKKNVDAMLLRFDLSKSPWFWYGNAKVQRLGSFKTSALSSHLIIFNVSAKVNSSSKSKFRCSSSLPTSLFFSVMASLAIPDEVSRTGVYGSTLSDQATLMKFLTSAAQAPTMATMLFVSLLNSPMESEKKRISTASPSRLSIFLLLGCIEIHIVSQGNIDGCRVVLFRLTGALASVGFPPLFKPLSLGYFNVFSDYLKLFRAVVSRIQAKIIRGSLYFELVSPCNTSILATLVSYNLREAVKLPYGEDINQWLAIHTIDFYNQVNVLYATLTEFCTTTTCPIMNAGSLYEYRWADGIAIKKPITVSAPEYVGYLMNWIVTQIDNGTIFPQTPEATFPPNVKDFVKVILKRLFRVYAHIYHCHFQKVVNLKEEAHLNTCFEHLVLFTSEYQLIDEAEMEPLKELVGKVLKP